MLVVYEFRGKNHVGWLAQDKGDSTVIVSFKEQIVIGGIHTWSLEHERTLRNYQGVKDAIKKGYLYGWIGHISGIKPLKNTD